MVLKQATYANAKAVDIESLGEPAFLGYPSPTEKWRSRKGGGAQWVGKSLLTTQAQPFGPWAHLGASPCGPVPAGSAPGPGARAHGPTWAQGPYHIPGKVS